MNPPLIFQAVPWSTLYEVSEIVPWKIPFFQPTRSSWERGLWEWKDDHLVFADSSGWMSVHVGLIWIEPFLFGGWKDGGWRDMTLDTESTSSKLLMTLGTVGIHFSTYFLDREEKTLRNTLWYLYILILIFPFMGIFIHDGNIFCWNSWPPGYPLYRYMYPRLYTLVARVKRSVLNGYTSSPGIL